MLFSSGIVGRGCAKGPSSRATCSAALRGPVPFWDATAGCEDKAERDEVTGGVEGGCDVLNDDELRPGVSASAGAGRSWVTVAYVPSCGALSSWMLSATLWSLTGWASRRRIVASDRAAARTASTRASRSSEEGGAGS